MPKSAGRLRENVVVRLRVGGLDLPEGRTKYTSRQVEAGADAHNCPCGKVTESRTHFVGECELKKEDGDVNEDGMREINEDGVKSFGTSDRSEKLITILRDTRWPQMAEQEGG